MKRSTKSQIAVFLSILVLNNPVFAAYKPTDRFVCHYVSPGDNLSTIAQKYLGNARAYRAIAKLNNIINPDLIVAGRYIRIELNPPTVAKPTLLTVLKNESDKKETATQTKLTTQEGKSFSDKRHGLRVGGLYLGGGGGLQVSNDFKVGPVVLNLSGGVGLGKNYTMANVQLSKEFGLPGDIRLGLSGVYAYYSKYIINVPWTNQSLDKGSNFGLGAYLAKDLNDWEIRGGYSPIIGPNLGVSKYF